MKTVKTALANKVSFASKLHPKLGTSQENSFYSPHSLLSALGMCAAGAREETLEALTDLLGVPTDPVEQKAYFRSLVAEASVSGKPYELTTANALWSQANLSFVPDFAETVRKDYGGSFNEVDYEHDPEAAVVKINSWCNEVTRGKIPEIIQRDFINEDTLLILTNAIYFLGKWKKQFDKKSTADENFRSASGKTNKVPMMHQSGDATYGETKGFQALNLPYEGDDLSMLILLPEGPTDQIDNDLESAYSEAVASLHYEEKVNVSLPRFELNTDYKIGETLKSLGAGVAFSDSADFSGITTDDALKISEVVHKAFVKCDEEGTEAAAATAVGMMRCTSVRMPAPPKIFRADHPFVFFIHNTKTNTVLFCGRIATL